MSDQEGGPELVKDGWLTKSPADDTKLLKLYKSKWRRRYFVLSKRSIGHPDTSTGLSASLNYYESETGFKKNEIMGTIDLDNCEEINSHVETSPRGPAFSIRTLHKRQPRIYCLAADTAEEVEKWVHCLLVVLQKIGRENQGQSNYKITVSKIPKASHTKEARSFNVTRTLPARSWNPTKSFEGTHSKTTCNIRILKDEQDSGISSPTPVHDSPSSVRNKMSQSSTARECANLKTSHLQKSLVKLKQESERTSDFEIEDSDDLQRQCMCRNRQTGTAITSRDRHTIFPDAIVPSSSHLSEEVNINPNSNETVGTQRHIGLQDSVEHDSNDTAGGILAINKTDVGCSTSRLAGVRNRFGCYEMNTFFPDGCDGDDLKVISSHREIKLQKISSSASNNDSLATDMTTETEVNNGEVHSKLCCCICMEFFRDPRMLPCGHTFCLSCLTTMQNQAVGSIPCPICKSAYGADVQTLPKNFTVQDLLECWMKPSSSRGTPESGDSDPNSCRVPAQASLSESSDIQLQHSKTIELNCGKRITGITTVDNLVHFVSEYQNSIEVFDMNSSKFLPDIPVSQMKTPKDISYCVISKCFFIIDSDITNNCIWKLERTSKTPTKWLAGVAEPHTLSTTASGQLLVLQSDDKYSWNLRMYSTSETTAKQCQSISLSPAIKCPRHAISQTPDQYFICYGTGHKKEDGHWSVWTVSQVSRTGNILKSFAMPLVGPLYYITANDNNTLFISEGKAKQIVCIGFQLEQFHLLKNSFGDRKWEPWKLGVSRNNRLLIIGHTTKLCDMFTY